MLKTMLFVLIMVACDYTSGVIVAFSRKSKKTETGGFSSKAGFVGLCKKLVVIFLCIAGYIAGETLASSALFPGVCMSVILMEIASVLENLALLGIHIPKQLMKILDIEIEEK